MGSFSCKCASMPTLTLGVVTDWFLRSGGLVFCPGGVHKIRNGRKRPPSAEGTGFFWGFWPPSQGVCRVMGGELHGEGRATGIISRISERSSNPVPV